MQIYLATYILDIAALLYLLSLLNSDTSLNSERKKPFIFSIVLTVLIILSEAGTIFTSKAYLNIRILHIMFNVLGFSLTPMIPIAITLIFDSKIFTSHKSLLLPTIINIVATVLSPFINMIFFVDANNGYLRGKFFFIFVIVYIVNYAILIVSTMDIGKKYNYPIKQKMMTLFLFTVIGTSIQLINPLIYSSWHCVTLTIFLYFLMMSEFDSSFDTLSGLYNRAALDRVISEIQKAKALTVVILDIDDFKLINDTYGHDYGDHVIKEVATIIKESFGKHYKCYRYGGDEFAVISNDVDSGKTEGQLNYMTKALAEMREKGHILPTVSYGYSFNQGDETLDFNKVLKEADEQMYQHKRAST